MSTLLNFITIIIWNHNEKCIQISTNPNKYKSEFVKYPLKFKNVGSIRTIWYSVMNINHWLHGQQVRRIRDPFHSASAYSESK